MLIQSDHLKNLILKSHSITQEKVTDAELYAKNADTTLYEALLEKNYLSDEQLGTLIAGFLKVPFVVLSRWTIPRDTLQIIPERVARKQKAIPFTRDKTGVWVAMADPTNTQLLQMVTKKTGLKVHACLATERDIYATLHFYKKDLQTSFDNLIKEAKSGPGKITLEDAPIAKIVDLLINYAYQERASDIHLEIGEGNSLVRFRIDGILHDVLSLPKNMHDRIITRIKVLSRLRTDEHLTPQDGKIRLKLEEENLDIRVSILPMVEGEKTVLRLLSSFHRAFSLHDLGMTERDLKIVFEACHKSYGMILATGPTGSGKSTSIYAILRILNVRETNITTIEEPVEYRMKGVNQIQVNTKTNLTFARGLRSILRQDPNIIFVGEIRDSETAGIAVNAALTGHLVLSTLHTNDAATALPRLTDMKIEPFLVASTVNVIVAQRLIRKICDNCRISSTITEEELSKSLPPEIIKKNYLPVGEKKEIKVYQGKGCNTCHFTGYSGRVGIFEVLEVNKHIKKLITEMKDSDEITRAAVADGMTTMLDDGLQKVSKGITTIEEVLRVTKTASL